MKNKIETGLVDFLVKNMGFSPEKIDALAFKNMTLGELYLDSLMLLELGIFLEEEFGIALDPA